MKKKNEMEDDCPKSWECPSQCYEGCMSCLHNRINEDMEMEADLIRKYGDE